MVHFKITIMKNSDRKSESSQHQEKSNKSKKEEEKKIDEQVEESFPASDPPSHVDPGSDRKEEK